MVPPLATILSVLIDGRNVDSAHIGNYCVAGDFCRPLDESAVNSRRFVGPSYDHPVVPRAFPLLELPVKHAVVKAYRSLGIVGMDFKMYDSRHTESGSPVIAFAV